MNLSQGRHELAVHDLSCGHDGDPAFQNLEFEVGTGSTVCLLGPNGVGKTTLFKTLLGFLKPLAGTITFDGEDMADWSRRQYGQRIGYIPQMHMPSFPFTVFEVVSMGRTPFITGLRSATKEDERIALEALETLGILELRDRDYTLLSGGERQMVLIARALAQQPAFLVMDEPTSSLDLGNQATVLERIEELSRNGFGVLMTTHDPNQAFILDGQVICLERGGDFLQGQASDVLDEENLSRLYGVRVGLTSIRNGDASVCSCAPLLKRNRVGDDG